MQYLQIVFISGSFRLTSKCEICFCDKDHMKNCLGLNKGYSNIFKDRLKRIELNASYRNTPYIVQQIAKAQFDNVVEIKILPKEPW